MPLTRSAGDCQVATGKTLRRYRNRDHGAVKNAQEGGPRVPQGALTEGLGEESGKRKEKTGFESEKLAGEVAKKRLLIEHRREPKGK